MIIVKLWHIFSFYYSKFNFFTGEPRNLSLQLIRGILLIKQYILTCCYFSLKTIIISSWSWQLLFLTQTLKIYETTFYANKDGAGCLSDLTGFHGWSWSRYQEPMRDGRWTSTSVSVILLAVHEHCYYLPVQQFVRAKPSQSAACKQSCWLAGLSALLKLVAPPM